MKAASNAESRKAVANHKLESNVKDINSWETRLMAAKNLFTIAKHKDTQIKDTWFFIKQQWDTVSEDRFRSDFDSAYSQDDYSGEQAKRPTAPTFVSTSGNDSSESTILKEEPVRGQTEHAAVLDESSGFEEVVNTADNSNEETTSQQDSNDVKDVSADLGENSSDILSVMSKEIDIDELLSS
jgi:hypothetical protein